MFTRLHGRDEYGGGTGAGLTIVRKLVERLSAGHTVTAACGGREAMDLALVFKPDVVFLDIGLPDSSGKPMLRVTCSRIRPPHPPSSLR